MPSVFSTWTTKQTLALGSPDENSYVLGRCEFIARFSVMGNLDTGNIHLVISVPSASVQDATEYPSIPFYYNPIHPDTGYQPYP